MFVCMLNVLHIHILEQMASFYEVTQNAMAIRLFLASCFGHVMDY